jgi:NAD(P)-dependent dehydrogenase (short-subunit alcohol dehydrogenase family)
MTALYVPRNLEPLRTRMFDQGHAEELQRAVEQVVQEFHRLDIVIGNAAVGSGGRLLDLTARQREDALRVNLMSE